MRIRKFANQRVHIGNISLEVLIEYTNRKRTISLQLKDNKIIIKAPRTVSRKNLDEVIQKKQKWIKQRAILYFEEQKLRNRKFIDNEKFYFRGNQYRLSLIFGKKERFWLLLAVRKIQATLSLWSMRLLQLIMCKISTF